MNYYIQQNIHINMLKIGSLNNSSVFQIGSAGIIKPVAHLYNTGGFTKPAPEATEQDSIYSNMLDVPSVPLSIPIG